MLDRLVVGCQFFLHDIAQVVEEGFRVGQARDHPGLGRRLFQRDRTGDGRAQAVVVQVELHCIVMAPVGAVEVPARQGDGQAGTLQGALQVIGRLLIFVIVRTPGQRPVQVEVGCGDERSPQRRADDIQQKEFIRTLRRMGHEGIEELAAQGPFIDVAAEGLHIPVPGGTDDLGDGIIGRFHIDVLI